MQTIEKELLPWRRYHHYWVRSYDLNIANIDYRAHHNLIAAFISNTEGYSLNFCGKFFEIEELHDLFYKEKMYMKNFESLKSAQDYADYLLNNIEKYKKLKSFL